MFDYIISSPAAAPQTKELLEQIKHWDEVFVENKINELLGGRQFGSLADPGLEAAVWAESFYDEKYDLFVVVGTGRMHYHRALMNKLSKNQKLFILDWQLPLIWKGMSESNEYSEFKDATWYFHTSVGILLQRIALIVDDFLTRRIRFGFIPPYIYFFKDQVAEIEKQVSGLVTMNITHINTLNYFGAQWCTNYMENFPFMMKGTPFKRLIGAFKDVPAIVVSAGPSLEKNLHLLPGLKKNALIIGAGSVMDTLRLYGITPHLMGSFDGGPNNYKHFEKLKTEELRLVFTGDIYPQITREFKGHLIPLEPSNKRTYDYFKQFGAPELGEAKIGASVANMGLDVAVRLGCNPIILIGQDLAFQDGKSHAEGNAFMSLECEYQSTIKVKGNVEETVITNSVWYSMLKHFESQIANYTDIKIINATEGGAYIKGTEVSALLEVKEKYLQAEYDIESRLHKLLNMDSTEAFSEDAAEEVMNRIRMDIELHTGEVAAGLSLIENLIDRLEKKYRVGHSETKLINKLKKREDKLINSKLYGELIKVMIFGKVLYYERYYKKLAEDDPYRVELWVARYQYELFKHSLETLRVLGSFLDEKIKEKYL